MDSADRAALVPAAPQPGAPAPQPPASGPAGSEPSQPVIPAPQGDVPARPRRTRRWLVIAVIAEIVVAGGLVGWRVLSGGDPANSTEAAPPTIPLSSASVPVPVAAPLHPGLEPPRPGEWPRWMKFGSKDKVSTLSLDGLGFTLTLPSTWHCVPSGRADGYVKYACGATVQNDQVGGELIVRDCPAPCEARQQDTMRRAEEAWGLQWRQAGQHVTIAETARLNGTPQYALVMVGFWRSEPAGPLDRQLVLRMTSPEGWVDTLRRVASATRNAVAL